MHFLAAVEVLFLVVGKCSVCRSSFYFSRCTHMISKFKGELRPKPPPPFSAFAAVYEEELLE